MEGRECPGYATLVLLLCYFAEEKWYANVPQNPLGGRKSHFCQFFGKLLYIYAYFFFSFIVIDRKKVAKVVFY